jgi:hypothetical protein
MIPALFPPLCQQLDSFRKYHNHKPASSHSCLERSLVQLTLKGRLKIFIPQIQWFIAKPDSSSPVYGALFLSPMVSRSIL